MAKKTKTIRRKTSIKTKSKIKNNKPLLFISIITTLLILLGIFSYVLSRNQENKAEPKDKLLDDVVELTETPLSFEQQIGSSNPDIVKVLKESNTVIKSEIDKFLFGNLSIDLSYQLPYDPNNINDHLFSKISIWSDISRGSEEEKQLRQFQLKIKPIIKDVFINNGFVKNKSSGLLEINCPAGGGKTFAYLNDTYNKGNISCLIYIGNGISRCDLYSEMDIICSDK